MVLALGVAAALVLFLAEVTNVFVIDVAGAGCVDALGDPDRADECEITGGERHSYALIPIAILVVAMSTGAGLGGSRPAGMALVGAGLIVLAIVLIGDLPDADDTGQIGRDFTDATAETATGFWLALVGGGLSILAGLVRLLFPGPAAR